MSRAQLPARRAVSGAVYHKLLGQRDTLAQILRDVRGEMGLATHSTCQRTGQTFADMIDAALARVQS